jgi:hypothetical protein
LHNSRPNGEKNEKNCVLLNNSQVSGIADVFVSARLASSENKGLDWMSLFHAAFQISKPSDSLKISIRLDLENEAATAKDKKIKILDRRYVIELSFSVIELSFSVVEQFFES